MQKRSCLPIFYHPTNVMLIDDKRDFLDDVSKMISKTLPYITFTDPQEALKYLRTHVYNLEELSKLISERDFRDWASQETETFQLNFKHLSSELSLPNRYNKVAELYIDQRMPIMDGLSFCKLVTEEGLPVKRTMLTGLMGAEEAIQTLNDRIINSYLQKEDPDVRQKLKNMVEQQAYQQFQDLTISLTGSLSHLVKPIYDKHFIKIFKKLRNELKVIEFYMLDTSCSYLLIDKDGNAKILFVRQDADFNEIIEIGRNNQVPEEIISTVQNRKFFPYSTSGTDHIRAEGNEWEKLMTPMQNVPETDIFYAVVNTDLEDIFTFERYMKEIWKPS